MSYSPEPRSLPKVSIVTPAYGEMENLRFLLPETRTVLGQAQVEGFEIVVVLPASAEEEEVAEVEALGGRPVRRRPSDTFGDAMRTGIESIADDSVFVVTMDADGSHDPASIPKLLAAAVDGVDVVVASRYTQGGKTDNPPVLKVMSRALNLAYRLILRIKCNDISTNFKLYRNEQLRQVNLRCADFDVIEELLFSLHQQRGSRFTVVEVPDHFHERKYGETKRRLGPFTLSYLLTLARLRRDARSDGS